MIRSTAALALLSLTAHAQSNLAWLARHDSGLAQADYGRACAVDAAGNVVVVGKSYNPSIGFPPPPPSADFEIVSYTAGGTQSWSLRRDAFGDDDTPLDITCDAAGNVYVCGYSWSGTTIQWSVIKVSAAGAFQWIRHHSGAGSSANFARAVTIDGAGNVLVCGNESTLASGNDALVRCYDPAGNVLWSTAFDGGGSGDDTLYALTILPGGGLAACGQFGSAAGALDAGVARFTAGGALLSKLAFDGGANLTDGAAALCAIDAQTVALAGWTTTATTGEDWLVARVDLAANTLTWKRTLAGAGATNERCRNVALDARGVLWSAGPLSVAGSGLDLGTRRHDLAGNLLSIDTWGTPGAFDDQVMKLMPGDAGQMYVAGYVVPAAGASMAVLQYDESGARNWAATFTTPGTPDARILDAALSDTGFLCGIGQTANGAVGGYDMLTLQVDLNASPQASCTPKLNTLGCAPVLSFVGSSSASATSGFTTHARQVRNQKSGVYFYGFAATAPLSFLGGTLCVATPLRRALVLASGGSNASLDDCTGVLSFDWNAFSHGLLGGFPDPSLAVAGTSIHTQVWSRDPGSTFNASLSNTLSFVVLP
ncbi:MAG: hypothetical protein NTV21_01340 [Planctomycetota bacterium]|nr:hypothetical protein [Planctomycetota bacterium]